ncbi:MAG TPA: hypothetical protein VMB34_27900 [Acetobacteraceae bacterium]|nr:hypothetical protein [Acetobacteraceae bacterium]
MTVKFSRVTGDAGLLALAPQSRALPAVPEQYRWFLSPPRRMRA